MEFLIGQLGNFVEYLKKACDITQFITWHLSNSVSDKGLVLESTTDTAVLK